MSMNQLATQEMIQLSGPVLTDGTRQNEALRAVPAALANLQVMQAAHDELVSTSAGSVALDALRAILQQSVTRHDRLVRTLDSRLAAEIEAAEDPAERAALDTARGRLFPDGLALVQKSAAEKAGERELRERRVSPEVRVLLETVLVRGGSLADTYAQLQATSRELSVAESRRSLAEAEGAGPRVREARKRWVAAVNLIALAMEAAGADPTPVLGAIRAAQAREHADPRQPETPALPDHPVLNGVAGPSVVTPA